MGIDHTMLNRFLEKIKKLLGFAFVESVVPNFDPISNDKSSSCKADIQNTESSKTLEAGSTLSVKGLKPYWEDCLTSINSNLWLPTKIALQGLDFNSSNILSSKMVEKSWFSTRLYTVPKTNLPKVYLQSSMSSLVGCTDLGSTRTRKIRFYPNRKQKNLLKQCSRQKFLLRKNFCLERCVKTCLQQDN